MARWIKRGEEMNGRGTEIETGTMGIATEIVAAKEIETGIGVTRIVTEEEIEAAAARETEMVKETGADVANLGTNLLTELRTDPETTRGVSTIAAEMIGD